MEASIKGRDLITGLPREVIITDADLREAISPSINNLVETIKEVLETTPPEILSDVMNRGIILVGGGAMLKGLDILINEALKIPVYISEDPLSSVARGTGVVLGDTESFKDILISHQDELPPR